MVTRLEAQVRPHRRHLLWEAIGKMSLAGVQGELAGSALQPLLPLQDSDPGFGRFTSLYSLYLSLCLVATEGVLP